MFSVDTNSPHTKGEGNSLQVIGLDFLGEIWNLDCQTLSITAQLTNNDFSQLM